MQSKAADESYTGRLQPAKLQVQYQFAKASLRGYCDGSGSALYASNNLGFVDPGSLATGHLTTQNSNMVRHPATGVSCSAGSLRSMAD
eukprot:935733-Amphidinium_carterae.1